MDSALFTVALHKAHLTVTADAKCRLYGSGNPALTASLAGFQDGQILGNSGVTGAAACTTTAVAMSPVSGSPYPITCVQDTLASNNYDFTAFLSGSLTVNRAPLSIRANDRQNTMGRPSSWARASSPARAFLPRTS